MYGEPQLELVQICGNDKPHVKAKARVEWALNIEEEILPALTYANWMASTIQWDRCCLDSRYAPLSSPITYKSLAFSQHIKYLSAEPQPIKSKKKMQCSQLQLLPTHKHFGDKTWPGPQTDHHITSWKTDTRWGHRLGVQLSHSLTDSRESVAPSAQDYCLKRVWRSVQG